MYGLLQEEYTVWIITRGNYHSVYGLLQGHICGLVHGESYDIRYGFYREKNMTQGMGYYRENAMIQSFVLP